jgi:hypothetical protein
MQRKTILASLMVLIFLASVAAFGQKVQGMITDRTGETLLVKSGGASVTVVLTADTKTKDDRGLFGLDKQYMADVVLIPGLKVSVDGSSDDKGRVIAKVITVDGTTWERPRWFNPVCIPPPNKLRPMWSLSRPTRGSSSPTAWNSQLRRKASRLTSRTLRPRTEN